MTTIGALIERNASYYPAVDAFVEGDRRLSYRQFGERVCRLADGLYRLGLRRQDRVAILSMNRIEYFEIYGAAEWAGYIAAMMNFRLAVPEMAEVLKDAAPRILVFEAQYAEIVERLRPQLPELAVYICIGEGPDWALEYEGVLDSGSVGGPPIRSQPEDFCYLFYTSGSTGRAKGVPSTHISQRNAAQCSAFATGITGSSRVLQVTPAYHIGGRGYPLAALWSGGTVILQQHFDPVRMLEAIHKERVTHTFMVAAMMQAILDVPDIDRYDVSSMRNIISASAPIPVPLLKRGIERFGRVITVQYGMTEANGPVAVLHQHEVDPNGTPDQIRRLASVGHVVPEIICRIVDDKGADCLIGQTGEILIQSPFHIRHYWNNSASSLDTVRDGWLHTGDMGYRDEEGYLFLVDRKKDMIISGGENIYSREVELAVLQHPVVADAAVIGVPDPKWVETVKAIVVLKPGMSVSETEIVHHCRSLIAGYKCPRSVDFVNELPRLSSGKVDKMRLRQRFRS
ncbi:fatty-acyl-CoA synthase (plasmid) [Azospirillum sp. B510]|uniref:class I adenylate-forming enzyme family protein n=1 Tax=Azospirillum sp. (strain B510) TaxID=137722 RepID=UPI0001C4CB19|nr:AMP-binding protein [Azospirillum sp. B510]BAI74808.1 fatty-acyl-CoA synthase [Azospirillum sp. B510]